MARGNSIAGNRYIFVIYKSAVGCIWQKFCSFAAVSSNHPYLCYVDAIYIYAIQYSSPNIRTITYCVQCAYRMGV